MAENNKLKLLKVLDIMKKTDELHPINTTGILAKLAQYGIDCERKSVIRDLECLDQAGYNIEKCQDHNQGWFMTDQDFENYELKMLVDAVAAARFIPLENSMDLIARIKNLATKEGENFIERTMVIDPALKTKDKKLKQYFDRVMRAIIQHKQISFRYKELTAGNKVAYKRDGHVYHISPYYLALVNDEYFLLGNSASNNHVTHFRLEMLDNLEIMEDVPVRKREEIEELREVDCTKSIADYLRENVNMWTGNLVNVKLHCDGSCRRDIQVKFGSEIYISDREDGSFMAHLKVTKGLGFYQWLASYGSNIILEEPEDMRREFKQYLQETLSRYEKL